MNDTFIRACYKKDTEYTPVWFMRQVGRYLPQYRKLRNSYSIFEIIKNPELSAYLSSYASKLLKVDAAIIFCDITIPLISIGIEVNIIEDLGPVISNKGHALDKIINSDKKDIENEIPYVFEGIKLLKNYLKDEIPVVGFSAAPFTLLSYVLENKPNRDLFLTKKFMFNNEEEWRRLMENLTILTKEYLNLQIKYGVDAVQIFDSWAGVLSNEDYENYVLKYTKEIFEGLPSNIPKIHYCSNSAHLIKSFAKTSCDVISIDWRISIRKAFELIDFKKAIQGNLDPVIAVVGGSLMEKKVMDIIGETKDMNGFIFNLGHGVLKDTPVKNLIKIVDIVHKETRKRN